MTKSSSSGSAVSGFWISGSRSTMFDSNKNPCGSDSPRAAKDLRTARARSPAPGSRGRTLVNVLLLVAIAACLAFVPWGSLFAADFDSSAEATLKARVDRYLELRRADDW